MSPLSARSHARMSEMKADTLPNEQVIDDVLYEYGEYIYRVKRFEHNETGCYAVHNRKMTFNGKELNYCNPLKQLPNESIEFVRVIKFDIFPNELENFEFPNLENIEVINSYKGHLYFDGCLYSEFDENDLKLEYVFNSQRTEVNAPKGRKEMILNVSLSQPNNIKKIVIPNDVRVLRKIIADDNVVVTIDNAPDNIIVLENPYNIHVEYARVPVSVDFEAEGMKCTIINDNEVSIAVIDNTVDEIPYKVTYNGKTYMVTAISNFGFRNADIDGANLEFINNIGFGAFCGCEKLEYVVVGGSFNIGDCAFYGCSKLHRVFSFDPYGTVNIGISAFENCGKLKDVVIPNPIGVIESHAFSRCKWLNKICLPSQIQKIKNHAFSSSITSVIFSGEIPEMESDSFNSYFVKNVYFNSNADIDRLVKCFNQDSLRFGYSHKSIYVVVPQGITSFTKKSISSENREDEHIQYIYLPESIETIEDGAFADYEKVKHIYSNSKKYVGNGNFVVEIDEENQTERIIWLHPSYQSAFDLPEKVIAVAKSAAVNATKLCEINFPDNELFIDELAFANCGLKEVVLNPKNKLFDKHVFKGSKKLKKITDQTGKVYDKELVDSYMKKLQLKLDEAKEHLVEISAGTVDSQVLIDNFYYALVEMACCNMIFGDTIEFISYARDFDYTQQTMNAGDLFAYEDDINELLNVNLANPSQEEKDEFVANCNKWMISIGRFRKTSYTYSDIVGSYRTCKKHNCIETYETAILPPSFKPV